MELLFLKGGDMPRRGAKGKWNLEVHPDRWYAKPDPFKVTRGKNYKEELKKAQFILGLIDCPNGKFIDIGCGEGHWTAMYAKNIRAGWQIGRTVVGVDLSEKAISRARIKYGSKVYFTTHDITIDRYNSMYGYFGTIILSEVLYYIHPLHIPQTVRNIYDMLSRDGQLIISCGQYYTENDIKTMFSRLEWQTFKLPSAKYEYNLIMVGRWR
jgi:SAM-dependent methyltransferase